MTLLVRSQGDPNAMSPIPREEVRAIDADLPLFGIRTMDHASSELLIQTSSRDPITIGGIAMLLAVVAVAASVWPARRATRLDPLVALRRD